MWSWEGLATSLNSNRRIQNLDPVLIPFWAILPGPSHPHLMHCPSLSSWHFPQILTTHLFITAASWLLPLDANHWAPLGHLKTLISSSTNSMMWAQSPPFDRWGEYSSLSPHFAVSLPPNCSVTTEGSLFPSPPSAKSPGSPSQCVSHEVFQVTSPGL